MLLKETGRQSGDEQNAYFIMDPEGMLPEDIVRSVTRADHAQDIAYEILKLSAIRNAKRSRFIGALWIYFRVLRLTFDCCMLLLSLEASVSNFWSGPEPDGRCTRVYRGRGRVLDGGGPVEQGYRDRSSVRRRCVASLLGQAARRRTHSRLHTGQDGPAFQRLRRRARRRNGGPVIHGL